ncbi:MAG: hypothetical protein ACPLY9_07125 [Nitrososphaerales archaeon]
MEQSNREHKIKIRNIEFSTRDYRAILAFILTIALIIMLFKQDYQASSILGPLAGSAIAWYFSKK